MITPFFVAVVVFPRAKQNRIQMRRMEQLLCVVRLLIWSLILIAPAQSKATVE